MYWGFILFLLGIVKSAKLGRRAVVAGGKGTTESREGVESRAFGNLGQRVGRCKQQLFGVVESHPVYIVVEGMPFLLVEKAAEVGAVGAYLESNIRET